MTLDEYNRAVDEWADRIYRFVVKSMHDEDGKRCCAGQLREDVAAS